MQCGAGAGWVGLQGGAGAGWKCAGRERARFLQFLRVQGRVGLNFAGADKKNSPRAGLYGVHSLP